MNLGTFVWRNLLRRKGRFALTVGGVAIGMAAFVGLLTIGHGLNREIEQQARGLGANLIVTPKGWCAYEQISVLTGEQLPEAIPLSEVAKISVVPGVKRAVPYLNEKSAFRNRPVPLIGILPQEMLRLQKWQITQGRYFTEAAEQAVVIGSAIARQFELSAGDEFTVRGRRLPVIGVLRETGSKDDIAAFVPLSVVQKIYEVEGMVSFVAVQVDDLREVDAVSLRIQEKANVAVVSDRQLLSSVLSIVGTVSAAMQAVAAVGVVAAAFGIINTLLTAVYERRREIGIMQAIGCTRRALFATFLVESGLYGLIGGLLGILIGLLSAYLFGSILTDNAFTASLRHSPVPDIDGTIVMRVLALSIGLAVLAGLYPAYRAAKLTPVEAMRHA